MVANRRSFYLKGVKFVAETTKNVLVSGVKVFDSKGQTAGKYSKGDARLHR